MLTSQMRYVAGHQTAIHSVISSVDINCLLCTQTITSAVTMKVVHALILLLVSAEAGEHRMVCGV